jgi:hypothetical protein
MREGSADLVMEDGMFWVGRQAEGFPGRSA